MVDISLPIANRSHLPSRYLYWLTKLADCFDTLFFVMRKKFNQITLLHMYHHTVVPLFGYLMLRINPLIPATYLFVRKCALFQSLAHPQSDNSLPPCAQWSTRPST